MATTGSFFFSFSLWFLLLLWQKNLRLKRWCILWLLTFWVRRRWMDGGREWEARGGMPWKHGFYHSIKIYTTTAGLQLRASFVCAWLAPLRSPPDCVGCRALVLSVTRSVPEREALKYLKQIGKSSCEQSERPAAADTSCNVFFAHVRFKILRSVTRPVWTSRSDSLSSPSAAMSALTKKNSSSYRLLPSTRVIFFFHVLRLKARRIETLGWSFVFCHLAAQSAIVSVQCADTTNANKHDLLV